MGILESLFNVLLVCTIIASLTGLFTIFIAILSTSLVLLKSKSKIDSRKKLPDFLQEDDESDSEHDPIYATNKTIYGSSNHTLNPILIFLLALFGIRYSPVLLRKRLGKLLLYMHRLCAITVLTWPSIQSVFYRFGDVFNLDSNLDFLEITELNFGISILLPLTYIWLIYAFFAGKWEKLLSTPNESSLQSELAKRQSKLYTRSIHLYFFLLLGAMISLTIGIAILTYREMTVPNWFVISIIFLISISSGIFGCVPFATAIFVCLICQKLSNSIRLLPSDIIEGRISLANAKMRHLETKGLIREASRKLRSLLILWFISLIPCVIVFTISFFTPTTALISPYKNVTLLLLLILLLIWLVWSCTKPHTEYKQILISLVICVTDEQIAQSGISKESFSHFLSFLEKVTIKFNLFGLALNRKLWMFFTSFLSLILLVVLQQFLLILPNNPL